MNDGNIGALAIKTMSKKNCSLSRKISGHKAQFSAIKNKASLEVDVLDKDTVNVVAVDNNDGNHFFISLS